jgi:hypothetical protein
VITAGDWVVLSAFGVINSKNYKYKLNLHQVLFSSLALLSVHWHVFYVALSRDTPMSKLHFVIPTVAAINYFDFCLHVGSISIFVRVKFYLMRMTTTHS